MLTVEHRRNKIPARAARRGGTFHLKRIVPVSPNSAHASHLLPTYARVDLAFERGEGAWLIATNGERYLDFTSGVAVNALGHAHPHLVEAVTEQAKKLWHVSNLYRIPEAERLAERLCEASFADVVFFANSGAEAMECAIKMARKYQSASGKPERYRIITFEGAFHGRTLATLAAGGQKKYLEGFGPVVEGFDQVPFADLEATKRAIGPETAAILIEPIMGEGGVRVVPPEFLRALRRLCDEHGLLLIFDEVQTGVGRTGKLFAYQQSGVSPDIMALAKAHRRRLPARRLPRHRRGRQGHDRRHPRLDLRRQSAGDGGGNGACSTWCWPTASSSACGAPPSSSSSSSRRSRTAIPPSSPRCAARGCWSGCARWCPVRSWSTSCGRKR